MTIVLIGAGNLGHHLGLRLAECGMAPVQVYSRQLEKAGKLADAIEARAVNDLSDIQADADLYILAVADDAIETVAQKLARRVERGALVVHTSGTTSSMAVGRHFSHYGVLYPLGAMVGAWIVLRSWVGMRKVEWKGRTYRTELASG